nr:PREDICTED: olfactory receptor 52Z1-like [Latimeria chalumnae]|eukprot:XP_006012279.1 PREDICTED: olfactory receptor 52Z1-like [Latimeria chalumnae]
MEQNGNVTVFLLDGFGEMGPLSYLYFICALLLYAITFSINLLLIIVIILKKSLHEPMFIFLCSLFANGLVGNSALFPKLISDLLSEKKIISRTVCYVQVYFVHTYMANEMAILTVMAYDRYVAICNPLRYVNILTKTKTCMLSLAACLYGILLTIIIVVLTTRLQLCGFTIHKHYCDNMSIVKLACAGGNVNSVFGLVMTGVTAVIPLTVIVCSYIQIAMISLKASKGAQGKVYQTCITHLLTFFSFLIGALFVLIQHRLNSDFVPYPVHVFLSVEYLIVPPLFNPLIYGIRTEKIRNEVIKLFRRRTNPSVPKSQTVS